MSRSWLPGRCMSIIPLLAMTLAGGCATTARPGEIPIGEWVGTGTFVYEYWKSDDEAVNAGRSVHREYSTSLVVRKGTLGGRETVELEIVSLRGSLPGLDNSDRSHLRAALVKAKRLSDSTVLYRMVASQFNPEPDDVLELEDDAPPVSATCMTKDGVTVLQMQYGTDWVDTFRFAGRRLEKTGTWCDEDTGLIHWQEHLERKR